MSFSDLFDSGFKKRNEDHFASIVRIAMDDGIISDEEKDFIDRLARNLGLSDENYKQILKDYQTHPINPPTSYNRRLERLFDLSRMVYVDHIKGEHEEVLLRKIGVGILKEAITILDKANIKLGSLQGIPLGPFKILIKLPTGLATFLLQFVLRSEGNPKIVTSTLQSLRKGRKTEIDYLHGEFVKLGKKIGVKTPYNTTVVKLIHEIETTKKFYTPEELSKHFSFR